MSDVHTLQDSNLYGFWSPKQVYYMWQWKVEIFARNWGWSFKHETSTSHLGRGQLREAQFLSQRWSLRWSLGVTWPRVWSGASALKRRLETWKVWNSIFLAEKFRKLIEQPDRFTLKSFSWSCNMKSKVIQRIRISRVFWSLSSSSAAWRHCGWTAPWRRQSEFWGSRFPISTECVNVCCCLINVLCLSVCNCISVMLFNARIFVAHMLQLWIVE